MTPKEIQEKSEFQPKPSPEPGIYPGVPFQDYKSWEAVNNSLLWTLKTKSPFHAFYEKYNPTPATPSQVFGSALHTYILEPELFSAWYAIKPAGIDRRTKVGKAAYEQFLAECGDRQELPEESMEEIKAFEKAIHEQAIHGYIQDGRGEVSIVWDDPDTGIRCKGRIDYEREYKSDHMITDVKGTQSAKYRDFQKSIAGYGYYQQQAFYHDGWQILTGQPSICTWLACERSAPYMAMVYVADDEMILAGRLSYKEALKTYKECLESGDWPSYGDVEIISLPDWVRHKEGLFDETLMTYDEGAFTE